MNSRPVEPHTTPDPAMSAGPAGCGSADTDMIVFIEPNCSACDRVIATAGEFRRLGVVGHLTVFDRTDDPSTCESYGVYIYPSTYVNGRLAFHGEFTPEDFLRLYSTNEMQPVSQEG